MAGRQIIEMAIRMTISSASDASEQLRVEG
jgi:hypothetical protein